MLCPAESEIVVALVPSFPALLTLKLRDLRWRLSAPCTVFRLHLHGFGIAIAIFSGSVHSLSRFTILIVQTSDLLWICSAVPVLAVLRVLVEVCFESFEVQESPESRLVLQAIVRLTHFMSRLLGDSCSTSKVQMPTAGLAKVVIGA